jgi:hypothetical protein
MHWFSEPLVNDQRHMVTRSPEGGDRPSNLGLSNFKVLLEQKGVGPRVQKPESPALPEANKPVEQLRRPVLPKDREKIEAFVNDLEQNKEEILGQLETVLRPKIWTQNSWFLVNNLALLG